MARIIHIEDEPVWLQFIHDALADYGVDSAQSFTEALQLIRGRAPYELALVDLNLNLERNDDRLGGEILDLLKFDYPSTRRIVVTGRPPEGSLRANIFERYGVEEIIIKGRTTVPDLRRVVAESLRADHRGELAQDVKLMRSELNQRYQDWRESLIARIQTRVRDARDQSRDLGRLKREAAELARANLDQWLVLQRSFRDSCAELETALSNIQTADDAEMVRTKLNRLSASLADELAGVESPNG